MLNIPLHYFIILSLSIFSIGLWGVLVKKNLIVIFMSLEMMINSVSLLLLTFSKLHKNLDGEIFIFFIMAVAAAEAAVGLALVIALYRNYNTVNIDEINNLEN